MVGQGRPQTARSYPWSVGTWNFRPVGRTCLTCLAIGLLVGSLLPVRALAAPEDLANLRIRLAWGGGTSRQWKAQLRLPDGVFQEPRCLGLEADVPGSLVASGHELLLEQRSPRSYDGIEVVVQAPRTAQLAVDLIPLDAPQERFTAEIAVKDLLPMAGTFSAAIDDKKNRILVQRSPGDDLRVRFQRDNLVFSPGETFVFDVLPHELSLEGDTAFRCLLQLLRHETSEQVWHEERELRWKGGVLADPLAPVSVEMPSLDGVYDLVIALVPKRFTPTLLPASPAHQRKVQLIVVGDEPLQASSEAWVEELEIDLANPKAWDRLKRLAQLKWIPRIGQEPLSNQKTRPLDHGTEKLTQLDPGGWQAVPLAIAQPGQPHILEVDYPADLRQTLGISILEPNAAGQVGQNGLDSGIDVPDGAVPVGGGVLRHRLIFWPRTKTPFVLLSNRRDDVSAAFGKLRVLSGPRELPASKAAHLEGGRTLALYFDKPLIARNFGATEGFDEISKLPLEDWQTFYDASLRLVQYLKHVGYNTLVMSVAQEGSALYPSDILEPTPAYDKGIFFQTGQDPVRKDVLELLFRLCNREGIQFIPSIYFGSPLPELEQLLRRGDQDSQGIELIGDNGHSWIERQGTIRGVGPYYNPLDVRVQAAMRQVLDELLDRYGKHPSFGGLSIQLGPQTYAQLPDRDWGLDDSTMARFAREAKASVRVDPADRFASRAKYVVGEGRGAWLSWRARVLADFYHQIEQQISQKRSGARLILASAELYSGRAAHAALRPTLPARKDIFEATLRFGIQPALYQDCEGLYLPRPYRMSPVLDLSDQALNLELNRSEETDDLFRGVSAACVLHFHEGLPVSLPSFDAVSPFGPQNTRIKLSAHIAPSGAFNRRRFVHSLAALDPLLIIEGGAMIPLGQEEATRDLLEAYGRLPSKPMEAVAPKTATSASRPVVVRTTVHEGKTYISLTNDTPWPVIVHLQTAGALRGRLTGLDRRPAPTVTRNPSGEVCQVSLQPYDFVGLVTEQTQVKIVDWTAEFPPSVAGELAQLVQEVRTRAKRKAEPLTVVSNSDFEATNGLAGWEFARGEGVQVVTDSEQPRAGKQSLRMTVTKKGGVAWIRSQPFAPPRTGRVSVMVWLRTRNESQQPPLRLAIEGVLDNRSYYRYAAVGRIEDSAPAVAKLTKPAALPEQWASDPFLFHVDDLPPSGLTALQVGFDLMDIGDVWIDDVQVFDAYFQSHERNELWKEIAATEFNLESGNILECERFLDGYWPRFLLHHVPNPGPATRVAERTTVAAPVPAEPPPPQIDTGQANRMDEGAPAWRRYLPRVPFRNPLKKSDENGGPGRHRTR